MGTILALITALGAGVLMALQGSLNSALGKIIGMLESIFLVHLIGIVFITVLLFVFRLGQGDLGKMGQTPLYLYLGGFLGVGIVYGVIVAISRVGVTSATTAIIVGQVSTAALVDHLGLFGLEQIPFNWVKLVGFILLVAGGRLLLN